MTTRYLNEACLGDQALVNDLYILISLTSPRNQQFAGRRYLWMFSLTSSTIIVGRQLRNQEWKLLGHIYADKRLLTKIGVAIGEREDNLDNLANAAQGGWANFYARQRKICGKRFGCPGINIGIAHSEIV